MTKADYKDRSEPKLSKAEVLKIRQVALDILSSFWDGEHFLDSLFDENKSFAALDQRNRNFVRMMVTTAIRRHGQVEDLLKRCLSRPNQKLSPPKVRYILHLGIVQIVFMNVADHAAVSTTVDLAEKNGARHAKGFINAVLRKIVANGRQWTTEQDISRLNVPNWLFDVWTKDYGKAEAVEIAQASIAEAELDLTVADPIDRDKWAEVLSAKTLPNGTLRSDAHSSVKDMPGFDDGAWWVQDAAASLPVKLIKELHTKTVVDLCAAPGGKTMQLAIQGANVHAVDRSARRLDRLKENVERLNIASKVTCHVADGALWEPNEKVDAVLLDAPCTATGTMRRNPDVAWLKNAENTGDMSSVQERLLDNAAKMLEDGGTLIYCTCSLQKDEGERQVDAFLKRHGSYKREPITPEELPALEQAITDDGDVRVLPFYWAAYGGIDGFFISRLRKT